MNVHAPAEQRFAGVRLGGPSDKAELFLFLSELHKENGMFPMDAATVMDALDLMLNGSGVVGIIRGAKGVEGSIGLTLEPWWYTKAISLNERWNYVHPDHRRSTHARRLIEFAKWASDKMGAPLMMGIISSDRTEAKVRLYRRQLDYVGAFFSHGMPPERQNNG